MRPGKTGDEILAECRATMANEGLKGSIYSHPIGDFGHSAGTPIGMTNLQKCELPRGEGDEEGTGDATKLISHPRRTFSSAVPVSGQLPMLPHTWYSIELSAESFGEYSLSSSLSKINTDSTRLLLGFLVPEWNLTQNVRSDALYP